VEIPIPQLTVLWTYQTGGPVWGTPAVDDGVVFFGSDDASLYALEAKTGQLKWKFDTQGIVRSRPAVAGGRVYVTSDDGRLYAVEAGSGQAAWSTDIGNAEPREEREKLGNSPSPLGYDYVQSSPVVADGQVYAGSRDGKVYALDAQTGAVRWSFATGEKVRATPAVANGTVYVGSWDKNFYALDAQTGQPRWSADLQGQVQTTALVADGRVYVASRKAAVFGLDEQTGEKLWEYSYGGNMWVESSPWLESGVVYIGSSGSKMVMGLDAATGEVYTALLFTKTFNWSRPAISNGTLFYGGASYTQEGYTGGLYAYRLEEGKFPREKEDCGKVLLPDTLEADGNWSGMASSPVIVDGVVYIGGLDGKLYAVTE
jgi:outer membrane protein assembly factor BamB